MTNKAGRKSSLLLYMSFTALKIWVAYTVPAPEFAKMVIRTCSLILNGPRLSENSNLVSLKNTRVGRVLARKWPIGTTAICAEIEVTIKGCVLYQKNWFTKDNNTHERTPRTHILNVRSCMVGSSVLGTVSSTCFTGHSSSLSAMLLFSFSKSDPPSKVEAMVEEYVFSWNTKKVLKVKSHLHVICDSVIWNSICNTRRWGVFVGTKRLINSQSFLSCVCILYCIHNTLINDIINFKFLFTEIRNYHY